MDDEILLLFLNLSANMLESHAETKLYLVFSAISILEQKMWKDHTTEFFRLTFILSQSVI